MSDFAYLAGIIDGEGTITLSYNSKNDAFRRLFVSVANTDCGLINWLQERFGGKVRARAVHNPKHRPAFEWRIEQDHALRVLKNLSTFLRVESKRRRAEYILAHYKSVTVRNGRYTPEGVHAKKAFEATVLSFGSRYAHY